MREIEKIIEELADNLKSKLLLGEYKILQIKKFENKIEIEGFVLNLFVDTCYPETFFGLYLGSILDSRFYNSDFIKKQSGIKNNIEKLFDLGSETLRISAWRVWKEKEKEYIKLKGKRDRQKQINRLTKEIQELEAEKKNEEKNH
jgi:hypothetical protein